MESVSSLARKTHTTQQTAAKDRSSSGAPTPNLTPGIILQDSGSASSTAYATLTDGNITIGGQNSSSAAGLGAHTDLATANSAIAALPDLRNVMKEQQAMAAAANTVIATTVQIAGDIAKSKEKDAQTKGDLEEARKWGPTGEHTRDLKTIVAVLVGGLAGQGAGQLAATAAAPYLANAIGDYFSQPGNENQPAQVLSHALLGGILAAASGGNAGAGAIAGATGEIAAQVMTKELYPQAYDADGHFHPEKLSEKELNTVIALSAAAGIALSGIAGGTTLDMIVGGNIAGNAATNNFLKHSDAAAMKKELEACKAKSGLCSDSEVTSIVSKYKDISDDNIRAVQSCVGAGDVKCVQDYLGSVASSNEVKVLPFGFTSLENLFIERQRNIESFNSVYGQYALFGTDLEQAAEISKFRQENCGAISSGACDNLVQQAINYRLTRMVALTALNGSVAMAANAARGLRLPPGLNRPITALDIPELIGKSTKPFGVKGQTASVHSVGELKSLFEKLTVGGSTPVIKQYGVEITLADGTTVTLRDQSNAGGMTIDINYKNSLDGGKSGNFKVHINQ